MRVHRRAIAVCLMATGACHHAGRVTPGAPTTDGSEHVRVLAIAPNATATIVAPARLDTRRPVELILYALPNGNSTAETMGRRMADGVGWRYDIQHIGAQTRALRARGLGLEQAIVVYLEANSKSWPSWRSTLGYSTANARIVQLVDEIRAEVGHPEGMPVTLTGHSGGGSFMFGFIEGQDVLPSWLTRIAFLDAIYNFAPVHGDKLVAWLRQSPQHRLISLAYDDREIMLDGKKVVSDSGGTWRATERLLRYLAPVMPLAHDSLGGFDRYHAAQIELFRHPNPANRILHTEMIGEMNGYMHALLSGRVGYADRDAVLQPVRRYSSFVVGPVTFPPADSVRLQRARSAPR